MKILYCVQLTGNGHITRANELIRIFKKRAHVDVLVSGTQSSLKLKEKVKFRYKGLSFVFGKEGGIDFIKTIKILQKEKRKYYSFAFGRGFFYKVDNFFIKPFK